MKPLCVGDRVVAVYMNGDGEVRRGVAGAGRGGVAQSAYAADEECIGGVWLNFCPLRTEGVTWARGWDTKAANALRVAAAL